MLNELIPSSEVAKSNVTLLRSRARRSEAKPEARSTPRQRAMGDSLRARPVRERLPGEPDAPAFDSVHVEPKPREFRGARISIWVPMEVYYALAEVTAPGEIPAKAREVLEAWAREGR